MRQNWQHYQPFVTEGLSVEQYCQTHIEPHTVEIDNLRIQAAFDAIIRGAGMCVHILYFDRSDGVEIKPMILEPSAADAVNWQSTLKVLPAMRLLYRMYVTSMVGSPHLELVTDYIRGHYDLLYKAEDVLEHAETDAHDSTSGANSSTDFGQPSVVNTIATDQYVIPGPPYTETNTLDSISGADSLTDLDQPSVVNTMATDSYVIPGRLHAVYGDSDINRDLWLPGGVFNDPLNNIRPESLMELIPGSSLTSPYIPTDTDIFYRGRHVYADSIMPMGDSPYEREIHDPAHIFLIGEPNPDCELLETLASPNHLLNSITTSESCDDRSMQTAPMRM